MESIKHELFSSTKDRQRYLDDSSDIENEQERHEINLLTYNFFIRPPLINNKGNDYKDARIKIISKRMAKFDIISF